MNAWHRFERFTDRAVGVMLTIAMWVLPIVAVTFALAWIYLAWHL